MKGKIFIIVLAVLVSAETLQAQTSRPAQKPPVNNKVFFKPNIQLSLGSSFYNLYPGMNGFISWAAPQITMPVSKKLTISAGFAYTNVVTSGMPLIVRSGHQSPVQNFGTIYVSGHYQFNNKLSVTASGYKTFDLSPKRSKETIYSPAYNFSNAGAMVNINYKVNNHFKINAAFSMEQHPPYFFQSYGTNSPVFGTGYGTFMPPGGLYQGF